MIKRIVRMEFRPEYVTEFIHIFSNSKDLIRQMPGCEYLELFKDPEKEYIKYTVSYWESNEALENYRNSDLFQQIWSKTRTLFAAKPVAFSLVSEMKA